MPSLITLLGSCLVAASVAAAADRPANQAGEPWWSNPSTADHENAAGTRHSEQSSSLPGAGSAPADPEYRVPGPKVTEYAPGTMYAGSSATVSAPKVTETAPPGGHHVSMVAAATAELAPDPPSPRQRDTPGIVYPRSAAEKTKVDDSAPALLNVLRPLRHPATEPAAQHDPDKRAVPMPPAADAPPAAVPASPPAKEESARAPGTPGRLGLGSGHEVLLVGSKNPPGKSSPLSAMITVGGSLAVVLGLFFIVAWAMRKAAPRGSLVLPKEVFEILGRAPLGARQQVQLLRCGNKLLLVSITPGGTETLTEVTDPLEVDRIAGICQQAHPKSATTAFRQVFQQLAPRPEVPGARGEPSELDNLEPVGAQRRRYRWEK